MKVQNFDIEEFKPHTDKVSVGEKAELKRLCMDFNSLFGNHTYVDNGDNLVESIIDFTPKLSFKRGTYDKIKAAYVDKILKFNIRNSDLYNLGNKIDDAEWRKRRFVKSLRDIQDKMWNLKRLGLHNLEDDEEIADKTFLIINRMLKSLDQMNIVAKKISKNKEMIVGEVNLFIHDTEKPDDYITDVDKSFKELLEVDNVSNLKIRVYIRFEKVTINVKNENRETIGKLKMGPVEIVTDFSLFQNLNHHWNNADNEFEQSLSPIYNAVKTSGVNNDPYFRTHPFISNGHIGNGIRGFARESHCCVSDFKSNMDRTIWNHDFENYFMVVCEWLGTYITNYTHPLNSIQNSFHGQPKDLNMNFLDRIGTTNNCDLYKIKKSVTLHNIERLGAKDSLFQGDLKEYCNNCNLQEKCSEYSINNPSELYFQLLINRVINYGLDFILDDVTDDEERDNLDYRIFHEDINHLTDLAREYDVTENILVEWEMIYHDIYQNKVIESLISDLYKLYFKYTSTFDRNPFNKHMFVWNYFNYNALLNEDHVKRMCNDYTIEWEDELELFRFKETEEDVNQFKKSEEDEDYAAEMEEYMRNLIGTGQVREAQTRRRP